MWSKMLSANQISEFLNPLYLWKELINQRGFKHPDIDSRNVKGDL